MNPLIQSKNTTILPVLIALTLACFGLSPQARAVDPPPDGGYPNQNAVEDEDALLSRAATPGQWEYTGSLNTGRSSHTATLLFDGRVLVAGGLGSSGVLASAEIYDPATGTWSVVANDRGRSSHTATLLRDGQVLSAGGKIPEIWGVATARLYDPATRLWTRTGRLNKDRENHTATLLPDGKVLVAG